MIYKTLNDLMTTVCRHVPCNTNFASDYILPYIHYYEHDKTSKFVSEDTYNAVVHAAAIARQQNPQDLFASRECLKQSVRNIESPLKEKLYAFSDVAKAISADRWKTVFNWVHVNKCNFPVKDFAFSSHHGVYFLFDDYQKILAYTRTNFVFVNRKHKTADKPKPRHTPRPLPYYESKSEPKPKEEETPTVEEMIRISVCGLCINVSKTEAIKIAQSIMDQMCA